MNTIANHRAMKARISKGWAHDPSHYRFERVHNSNAPFADDAPKRRPRDTIADALIGVLALAALIVVLLFSAGAY